VVGCLEKLGLDETQVTKVGRERGERRDGRERREMGGWREMGEMKREMGGWREMGEREGVGDQDRVV
jgi:hypothetical protein